MPMIASTSAVPANTPVSHVRKRLAASCCATSVIQLLHVEDGHAGFAAAASSRSPAGRAPTDRRWCAAAPRSPRACALNGRKMSGSRVGILRNAAQVRVLHHADDRHPRVLARQTAELDAAANGALAGPEALRQRRVRHHHVARFGIATPRSVGAKRCGHRRASGQSSRRSRARRDGCRRAAHWWRRPRPMPSAA